MVTLLVTNSHNYPLRGKIEVIDSNGNPKVCTNIEDVPVWVESAAGGFVGGKIVICGGSITMVKPYYPKNSTSKCFR